MPSRLLLTVVGRQAAVSPTASHRREVELTDDGYRVYVKDMAGKRPKVASATGVQRSPERPSGGVETSSDKLLHSPSPGPFGQGEAGKLMSC